MRLWMDEFIDTSMKKNVKKIFDVDHNCQATSWTNAGNEWINEWMDGLPEAYDAT